MLFCVQTIFYTSIKFRGRRCVKVSFYSELKEIVSNAQKFRKDNIEVKKIVDLLKIVSFLIVCATFIVR